MIALRDIPLTDNRTGHNFELWVEGQRSFIDYKINDNKVYLLHTEVPKEQEGRGIAAALVEKSLIHIEEAGQKIVPLCAYVKAFLERHPGWNRLVAGK